MPTVWNLLSKEFIAESFYFRVLLTSRLKLEHLMADVVSLQFSFQCLPLKMVLQQDQVRTYLSSRGKKKKSHLTKLSLSIYGFKCKRMKPFLIQWSRHSRNSEDPPAFCTGCFFYGSSMYYVLIFFSTHSPFLTTPLPL